MPLIYKWVEGENEAIDLMCRLSKCEKYQIWRCENIMRIGNIRAERHSIIPPKGGYCRDMWLLIKPDVKGVLYNDYDIREKAYEDIRTGRYTFLPE